MANMSYCRFENTARDLRDCVNALQQKGAEDLDSSEYEALQEMVDLAATLLDIAREEGIEPGG